MTKAARIHRFGSPEVVVIDDVPVPAPAAGEVLVRVSHCGSRTVGCAHPGKQERSAIAAADHAGIGSVGDHRRLAPGVDEIPGGRQGIWRHQPRVRRSACGVRGGQSEHDGAQARIVELR